MVKLRTVPGAVPWDHDLPGPMTLGPSGPADAMFAGIPSMITLVFVAVLVLTLFRLFRKAQRFTANAAEPERTVTARVVGRRSATHGGGDGPVTTTHHVTFETPDGGRLELELPHREFGLVIEGDQGQLTHQGTWFRRFERTRATPLEGPWEAPGGPTLLPPPPAP